MRGVAVERLGAQALDQRQVGGGDRQRRQRRRAAARGLAAPVNRERLVQDVVEQLADALVFRRLAGFHELRHLALAARAHGLHHLGFLDELGYQQLQLAALQVVQRLDHLRVRQQGAQVRSHVGQLGLVVELLLKALEHPAFLRVQERGVAVEQLVDDRAAVLLRAQDGLAQRAVGVAP